MNTNNKMNDVVYSKNKFRDGWSGGLPETQCGAGSTLYNTIRQRAWIPKLIDQYGIKSISDIGAGDLNWIKSVDLPSYVSYKAFDLIPRKPEVITLDILKVVPLKSDLIMCLWVFNHLTKENTITALNNIKNSKSKYLLVTQRDGYYKPDFKILDMIVLNKKRDCLLMVEL